MGSISKYWQFVKLDSAGKPRVEMMLVAKTHFQKQFPEWTEQIEVSDTTVQRQLWQQLRQSEETVHSAEICLRCYISHQIERACRSLGAKFGSRNGFTYEDLLPFVLDDQGRSRQSNSTQSYPSLATTILQSFDPAKGSLNTWVVRQVQQHPELKQFLFQHGVYLVSDWAILNDTTPKQLQRILAQMYHSTPMEIQQACALLQSYHAVYREDRIQQRATGAQTRCQPPTSEQLNRMGDYLRTQTDRTLHVEALLSQLQAIATKLRHQRIAAQGGSLPAVSFDKPEIQPIAERLQSVPEDEEHIEFLKFYQNQFNHCLEQAIAQVINNFISKLQRKRASVEQSFLTALHLFHCQGQSMGEIAPQIGLKKQYEVTRLLKLNDLRSDIRQQSLSLLRDRVLDKAKQYADIDCLQRLDQQVELILNEQIAGVIQEAEAEAKIPVRNQPLKSLLARCLCCYLASRQSHL